MNSDPLSSAGSTRPSFVPAEPLIHRARHADLEGVSLSSFTALATAVNGLVLEGFVPLVAGRDRLDLVRLLAPSLSKQNERELAQALDIAHSLGHEGIAAYLQSIGVRITTSAKRPLFGWTPPFVVQESGSRRPVDQPVLHFDGKKSDFTNLIILDRGHAHPEGGNAPPIHISNLFLAAIAVAPLATVQLLLEKNIFSADSRDRSWHSISLAVQTGRKGIIEQLYAGGADLNYCSRTCAPAIHRAVRNRDPIMLLTLLKFGANPDLRDPTNEFRAPLHVLAEQSPETPVQLIMAELLLQAGASKYAPWRTGGNSNDVAIRPCDLAHKSSRLLTLLR